MARSYVFVSVGVEYTGTQVGRDSIRSICAYTVNMQPSDERMFRYVLPLGGGTAPSSAASFRQEHVLKYGTEPWRFSQSFTNWIQGLCDSDREPVLVVADPIAEQFVRWYLVHFTGRDVFESEASQVMSARIHRHLRAKTLPSLPPFYIAQVQREWLIQLLDALDLAAGS